MNGLRRVYAPEDVQQVVLDASRFHGRKDGDFGIADGASMLADPERSFVFNSEGVVDDVSGLVVVSVDQEVGVTYDTAVFGVVGQDSAEDLLHMDEFGPRFLRRLGQSKVGEVDDDDEALATESEPTNEEVPSNVSIVHEGLVTLSYILRTLPNKRTQAIGGVIMRQDSEGTFKEFQSYVSSELVRSFYSIEKDAPITDQVADKALKQFAAVAAIAQPRIVGPLIVRQKFNARV